MKVIDEDGKVFRKNWAEMNEDEKKAMQDAFAVAAPLSSKVIKTVLFGEEETPSKPRKNKVENQ